MSKKKKNEQIPTPSEYVEEMLDRIGYIHDVVGKVVLENSCGQGNILGSIVERYILDGERQGLSSDEIIMGLERDIIAYEIDKKEIEICKNILDEKVQRYGLYNVNWNIIESDFLKSDTSNFKASFIIGNPPYITYHDIDNSDRQYIRDNYITCSKGRFDYCYAFIEASIKSLSDDGKLIYLIPFSIFRNRYAEYLRRYIIDYISGVVDFTGKKVFRGITCSCAFLMCDNSKSANILYENCESNEKKQINKALLDPSKWVFEEVNEGEKRFGDYFEVHNSVATLKNDVFLICPESEDDTYYYSGNNMIEKAICLPAVSTKSLKKKYSINRSSKNDNNASNNLFIIFPYKIGAEGITGYKVKEFKEMYPYAYKYMLRNKKNLLLRKSDKNTKWYEYGRSQALNEIWNEKLIISMVITREAKVYKASKIAVPYAGYFITAKKDSEITLSYAKKLLQRDSFYKYVESIGTPTTETSYRISVDDIKNYRFD